MRPGAAAIAPLHVAQRVFLQLSSELEQSRTPLPFGLLAGALCVSPDTKFHYLLIDEVMAARSELTPEEPIAQLHAELSALVADVDRRGKVTIGWYLGGMEDDLQLDPEVATLHGELFPEVWQVVVVSGQESGIQRGAVLRFESVEQRFYALPFSEVLPEIGWRGQAGEPRTALRWGNYRSAQPVSPLDAPATAVATTASPSRGRDLGLGAFFGSIGRAGERSKTDDRSRPAKAPSPATRTVSPPLAPSQRLEATRPTWGSAQPSPAPEISPAAPVLATAQVPATSPPPPPATIEPAASSTVAQPIHRPELAVPESEVPRVFINGVLVDLPGTDASSQSLPHAVSATRRVLMVLLVVALIALVALAVYLSRG